MTEAPDEPPDDPDATSDGNEVGTAWAARPFLDRTPAGAGPTAAATEDRATDVRPFVVTRGRTAAGTDLAVEAQVVTTKRGLSSVDELAFEYRDIVDLCVKPLAVAELSARLGLHLGVVQVLLRDLTRAGYVTTFEPGVGLAFDVQTIQRVIDGLRRLV